MDIQPHLVCKIWLYDCLFADVWDLRLKYHPGCSKLLFQGHLKTHQWTSLDSWLFFEDIPKVDTDAQLSCEVIKASSCKDASHCELSLPLLFLYFTLSTGRNGIGWEWCWQSRWWCEKECVFLSKKRSRN